MGASSGVWWEFGGRSANCKSATMLPARLLTPCVPTLFLLTIVTKPPINWHKIDVVTLLSKSAVKEWYRSGMVFVVVVVQPPNGGLVQADGVRIEAATMQ